MSERTENRAMVYTPTLGDKVRRVLGYRFHHGDEPPQLDPAKHIGWMKSNANFKFSFGDRVRLLFSGRLNVELTQYPDAQVDECVNSVSYQIFAPFENDH